MEYYDYYETNMDMEEATQQYETSVYKYKGALIVSPCYAQLSPTQLQLYRITIDNILIIFPCVLFIVDERDTIQKKTFTKWVNKHLIKVSFLFIMLK